MQVLIIIVSLILCLTCIEYASIFVLVRQLFFVTAVVLLASVTVLLDSYS